MRQPGGPAAEEVLEMRPLKIEVRCSGAADVSARARPRTRLGPRGCEAASALRASWRRSGSTLASAAITRTTGGRR